MAPSNNQHSHLHFLKGGGEMGELIRQKQWNNTDLGSPERWPQTLKTFVAMILDNPFGMYIAWGKNYTQIYNDGYRPILGTNKHPNALGISTKETFKEIWDIIGPMFDGVMEGKAVGFPDLMLPLNRNGYVEECYFDFSYSPIRLEDGSVGGVLVTVIETTNKIKAETALRESEEKFRAMADNIPNLAWMANADGYIYWYNKQWYEYTGTTPVDMEGWGWQKVHDPKELPNVMERWQSSISTGSPFDMTFPLKGSDGKFKQFLTRVIPVFDTEGKLYQWFGSNTDITDQIQSEQRLRESEQRFRTMAEDADILIAISDETSNATYFNIAWSKLTGRTVEELLSFGWADLIHEDDRSAFLKIYLDAFEKRESWVGDFRVLSKDGNYRWLIAKGTVRRNPDNSFAGYISSSTDITEQKKAERAALEKEQNLRNTIIQAPVAMCLLRGKSYFVELANEKMFELWGKHENQVSNKPLFEGLPEIVGQGFDKLLDGVYETGKSYSAQGVPVELPRDEKLETVYVNFLYEPYRESDGSISGILAVAIDVTSQVIARQKIEEVVKERTFKLEIVNNDLQKSNAELAQFAYIASHDLQEPLRKIITFSEMLENNTKEVLDEQSKKYMDKIIQSSTRMTTLIRDVLTYSEVENKQNLFEQVDLNDIIKNVIADFELLIEQKGAVIRYSKLPLIEANKLQMSQLFSNLVGNALKFTKPKSEPRIEINVSKIEKLDKNSSIGSGQYYNIQFSDNGIGFSKDQSEKIFQIFKRLHRKSEYEGTGIGLALCKKIVLNHNGEISASSSNENGALFNIILPEKQSQTA